MPKKMNTSCLLQKYVCVFIGVDLNKFTKFLEDFYLLQATDKPKIKNIRSGFVYLDKN